MAYRIALISYLVLSVLVTLSYGHPCELVARGVTRGKNINDVGRFIIEITGNPDSYVPLQQYTVTLKLNPTSPFRRTFREFMLVVESLPGEDRRVNPNVGYLQLSEDMKARFSDICPNTVTQASSLAKTEVKLFWQAPPPNSGCVVFKAVVVESRESWFAEDGPLTRILCEENEEDPDTPPPVLRECCACDEATYEVAFEGIWSRNTHPKDFPNDLFSTRFSDVIGASHAYAHAFWSYNSLASEGLKLLAEEGDTSALEDELKDMNENIRTIIKARGLTYPDIKRKTYAIFRVDNKNHLISLVSKVTPSPDWIVGISNFELCTKNCSWLESRTLNLYPWDAGTDDGITYTSPKSPRDIPQTIRRLRSNSPSDERSPFFDEDGEEMNPMARLHITRLRVYMKSCDENGESETPTEETPESESSGGKCATTEWSEWSDCSTVCEEGEMFRSRQYVNPADRYECYESLVEKSSCFIRNGQCENEGPDGESGVNEEECEFTEWGPWSSCSATCGTGTRTRERSFQNIEYADMCARMFDKSATQENEECSAESDEPCDEEEEEECLGSEWGYWTSCNATCEVNGIQERYRIPKSDGSDESYPPCTSSKLKEVVECYANCDEGGVFGGLKPGANLKIVSEEPVGPVRDCKVTRWSAWSECIIPGGRPCGNGYKQKYRRIKVHPMNGGKPCPNQLFIKRRCHIDCENEDDEPTNYKEGEEEPIDCEMGEWSEWSPCSAHCGHTAVQQRTRNVRVKPNRLGKPCPPRIETKDCPLPVACTPKGEPTL